LWWWEGGRLEDIYGECDGGFHKAMAGDEEWGFLCNGLRLGGNVLGAMHTRQSI